MERHIEAEDEPRAHGRCGDDERHQRLGTQKAAQQAVNAIIVPGVHNGIDKAERRKHKANQRQQQAA